MELAAAGLGDRGDERRALLVFRIEVGGENLELLNEIGVGVDRGIAVATRVGNVRAVRGDVKAVVGQTVVGEGSVERALAAGVSVGVDADGLTAVVGLVGGTVLNTEAGNNLDVLGSVGADLSEVLQFLGFESEGFLSRVGGHDRGVLSVDFHGLTGRTDDQRGVDVAIVTAVQLDRIEFVRLKTSCFDGHRVRTNRN